MAVLSSPDDDMIVRTDGDIEAFAVVPRDLPTGDINLNMICAELDEALMLQDIYQKTHYKPADVVSVVVTVRTKAP